MAADDLPIFSKESLPPDLAGVGFEQFRKTSLTWAKRIEGPFRVETSESENEPFLCEDGWLELGVGDRVRVAASVHREQIYERA